MKSLLARPWVVHVAVFFAAVVMLCSQIGKSGVWDPYELDNAELARRVSVHVFAARTLAVPSDPPTIPTTSDLGMGELPYTSMGLLYRLFGWHDWTGRLALALWAVAGAMALYVLLARAIDRRAGVYGVIVLSTMPLYFLQARTMMGDATTLAAYSISVAGLALAVIEPSVRVRAIAFAFALAGLVAGYFSRGLLLGVAAPLLTVGAAGALWSRGLGRIAKLPGLASIAMLVIGAGATAWFLHVALPLVGANAPLKRAVGMAMYEPTAHDATFDRILRQLGHALFPWSALLPFAIGRLTRPPPESLELGPRERESFVRLVLLAGAGVGVVLTTLVTPYSGAIACVSVAALAGVVAIVVRDLERGAPASRLLAFGAPLLGAVLFYDLKREPARMLASFGLEAASFPSSFDAESTSRLEIITGVFLLTTVLAWIVGERPAPAIAWGESYFEARSYFQRTRAWLGGVLDELGDAWNGNLVFAAVVIEAALVGLGAMLFVGSRAGWESIAKLPRSWVTYGLNFWWQVPIALVVAVIGWIALRDGFDLALRVLRARRGTAIVSAGLLAGVLSSFGYYPALARQLSPKEMFETFAAQRKSGEELGLLGLSARAASFYYPGDVSTFEAPHEALPWLVASGSGPRRWLVLRARDLPKMNSMYRADFHANLPILDARSSQILLASSSLGGQPNQNPFDDAFPERVPRIQHPVSARFTDEIESLGWDIVGEDGAPIAAILPGKTYTMHFYYRALKPIAGNWQGFIHVDGKNLRHNADHPVLDGRYPMSLWQSGDIVVDTVPLELEPNFLPGEYWVYYGFFNSSTRMKVTDGPSQQDRVVGGKLVVR